MPDIDIDKLQIEVSASSSNAAQEVRVLADELKNLKSVLNGKWDNPVGKIKPKTSTGKQTDTKPNTAGQELETEEAEIIREKISLLSMLKQRWAETRASLKEKAKLNIDSNDVDKAKNRVNILDQSINSLKKTLNSIKRIAVYRAIRSGIRAISSAFSEGLENAYRFSQLTNGQLSYALDNIATKSAQMKNQLGAAAGTLIMQLEPVLIRIIGWLNQLAQSITWLFAVFSGAETYLVANEVATSWKEADKAAKAYRRTLLGIDEINRLSENSASASAATNFEDLFHKETIDSTSPVAQFVVKLKDVLFKWDDFTPEFVATKVLSAVFGIAGGIIGWTIGGAVGGVIGLTAGAALAVKISDVLFNGDGNLNSEEIASLVMTAAFGISGGIIGWALGGTAGASVGLFVGAGLGVSISQLLFNFDGNLSDDEKLKSIMAATLGVAGGVIGWVLGGPIGAAIGLTIGVGLSLAIQKALFINDGKVTTDEIVSSVVTVLSGITGGVLGFAVGGPFGAVIGVTVGVGLSLLLNGVLFAGGNSSKNLVMQTLIDVLTMVGGGLLGFALGGPLGTVIGVTVGAGISMMIKEALFGDESKDIKNKIMESLATVLNGILGGMIGFAVGGPAGAALGATIGVSISLLAKSVDISSIKAKVSSAIDNVSSLFTNTNTSNLRNGTFSPVKAFATGGFPEDGLFYANHSELVGQFANGRTAVANNEQIVEGISEGVRDANTDVVTAIVSGVSQIINAMNENAQNGSGFTLDGLASALWSPMQHQNSVHGSSLVSYSR